VWIRTTGGDDRLDRPADLVERQFRAPAPNRLWVVDLTYATTHSGWVCEAFIVDVYSRMVVGWQGRYVAATHAELFGNPVTSHD
jgi:putative transposase